jgi:hypothetical protein
MCLDFRTFAYACVAHAMLNFQPSYYGVSKNPRLDPMHLLNMYDYAATSALVLVPHAIARIYCIQSRIVLEFFFWHQRYNQSVFQ